jgi:hypothetical protein
MQKRYQVFISSTFKDLIDERQSVLKAVLEIDHVPAGMELFPASDDTAWQLIKDVIDASDYYVLIIGGRYGSLDATGLGYTEKEYDYAVACKRPVIPLLHENPDNLPRDKTDTDNSAWERLIAFRLKVESRHTCVYWNSTDQLKAKVIVALTAATKRHPAVGWIRADQVPTEATLAEILSLRDQIAVLQAEIAQRSTSPPAGTEDLARGDDRFECSVSFVARPVNDTYPHTNDKKYTVRIDPSWNKVFSFIAPSMIQETKDSALHSALQRCFISEARTALVGHKKLKGQEIQQFDVPRKYIETCLVQFRALGLIEESSRKRSVRDTGQYWQLTPYGQTLLVQLRAIRRTPPAQPISSSSAVVTDG